jgi:hypothetical protein
MARSVTIAARAGSSISFLTTGAGGNAVTHDHEERIRRMEKRYEAARNALALVRSEFEMLSRAPIHAPARLAHLSQEIDRLARERARIGEQLAQLEDMVV